MSEIEKMEKYIKRSKLTPEAIGRYCMRWGEMTALQEVASQNLPKALIAAFDLGHAKGYRAAKAEARRE